MIGYALIDLFFVAILWTIWSNAPKGMVLFHNRTPPHVLPCSYLARRTPLESCLCARG